MATASPITEGDILERVLAASDSDLPPDVARALLDLKFPPADTNRIRALLRKNGSGTLVAPERLALEKYLRVGQFLDLLHARARAALAVRRGTG
jgi:hypothetical protein